MKMPFFLECRGFPTGDRGQCVPGFAGVTALPRFAEARHACRQELKDDTRIRDRTCATEYKGGFALFNRMLNRVPSLTTHRRQPFAATALSRAESNSKTFSDRLLKPIRPIRHTFPASWPRPAAISML